MISLSAGCAASHLRDDLRDGGGSLDATTPDTPDGSVTVEDAFVPSGPRVECGPNQCRVGEICCNAECGVCAFPDECVDHGCL
ncbi:MAG: hypothetical protein AB8I08_04410 [Sandaracinaceae bacterium]